MSATDALMAGTGAEHSDAAAGWAGVEAEIQLTVLCFLSAAWLTPFALTARDEGKAPPAESTGGWGLEVSMLEGLPWLAILQVFRGGLGGVAVAGQGFPGPAHLATWTESGSPPRIRQWAHHCC